MAKHKLGPASEIAAGKAKKYTVNGKIIAVFNLDGKFYAIDDRCSHRGGPLAEGELQGAVVTCPWHGAEFNVMDGKSLNPIATDLKSYRVVQEGDELFIEL